MSTSIDTVGRRLRLAMAAQLEAGALLRDGCTLRSVMADGAAHGHAFRAAELAYDLGQAHAGRAHQAMTARSGWYYTVRREVGKVVTDGPFKRDPEVPDGGTLKRRLELTKSELRGPYSTEDEAWDASWDEYPL